MIYSLKALQNLELRIWKSRIGLVFIKKLAQLFRVQLVPLVDVGSRRRFNLRELNTATNVCQNAGGRKWQERAQRPTKECKGWYVVPSNFHPQPAQPGKRIVCGALPVCVARMHTITKLQTHLDKRFPITQYANVF